MATFPRLIPIDIARVEDRYELNADLPGVDPSSVDVDVEGHVLTISAERTERSGGTYLRRLNLGQGIDTTAISASYENGVLSVVLPVSERAKARKVEVQTAA
jgi:HSP20 family protein